MSQALLELVAFLASSARGTIDEPHLYGSFRLIDAIQRLVNTIKKVSGQKLGEFFDELAEFIDKNKYKVLGDKKEYIMFLDELIIKITERAKLELKI